MKYLLALLVTALLAMLEVAFMPYFRVLDVTPNLVLIFLASWVMIRGEDEAFVIVPMGGFIRDLVTSDPLGTSALALAPIVLLGTAARVRSMDSDFVPVIVVVVAGTLIYGIISIGVLTLTVERAPFVDGLLTTVLPLAVVNALFTPAIYLPAHWLAARSTTRILGPGRIRSPL